MSDVRHIRRSTLPAVRPDALWLAGAAFVLLEALGALAGVHSLGLSAAAMLAPGLCLTGLLPTPMRGSPAARLAAAPALGLAAASVLVITLSYVGVPLGQLSVRLVLVALVVAGLWATPRTSADAPPRRLDRADLLEVLGVLAAVGLSVALGLRVVGTLPVPGNDWAKYLLYADEVRARGALLIENPYWMTGVPFREDPGIPALYGSALIASRAPAGALAQGILVLSVVQVLALYAYVRAWWGRVAGVTAAALLAVMPASADILGWHGLANVLALVLLVLVLAYLTELLERRLDVRAVLGMALTVVALVAAHRFSAAVGAGTGVLVLLAALVARRGRRVGVDVVRIVVAGVLLGWGVALDVLARQRTFGGSLPYTSYLNTKLDLPLAARDLSWVVIVLVAVGLVGLLARRRGQLALVPAVAVVVVSAAGAWAWVLHVALYYSRVVYFVPIAAAPLVAVALVRLLPSRVLAGALGAAAVIAVLIPAWPQAREVQRFYSFTDRTALSGLGALRQRIRPGEIVATDRCWSFLSTWLLSTRTISALDDSDIQPRAELPFARAARTILAGGTAGERERRRLGVRYAVVDPTCPGPDGGVQPPPGQAQAVFAGQRLAIVRLRR